MFITAGSKPPLQPVLGEGRLFELFVLLLITAGLSHELFVHDRDSNPQFNDLWHEASLPLHHSLNCEQETDIILLY